MVLHRLSLPCSMTLCPKIIQFNITYVTQPQHMIARKTRQANYCFASFFLFIFCFYNLVLSIVWILVINQPPHRHKTSLALASNFHSQETRFGTSKTRKFSTQNKTSKLLLCFFLFIFCFYNLVLSIVWILVINQPPHRH